MWGSRVRAVPALKAAPIGAVRDGSSARRGLRVVARVASSTPPEDGETRVANSVGGLYESLRDRVQRNFRMLPIALFCLLSGFALCALFPHPESPGDAPICFTIIFLSEFLSSVLYAAKRREHAQVAAKGQAVPAHAQLVQDRRALRPLLRRLQGRVVIERAKERDGEERRRTVQRIATSARDGEVDALVVRRLIHSHSFPASTEKCSAPPVCQAHRFRRKRLPRFADRSWARSVRRRLSAWRARAVVARGDVLRRGRRLARSPGSHGASDPGVSRGAAVGVLVRFRGHPFPPSRRVRTRRRRRRPLPSPPRRRRRPPRDRSHRRGSSPPGPHPRRRSRARIPDARPARPALEARCRALRENLQAAAYDRMTRDVRHASAAHGPRARLRPHTRPGLRRARPHGDGGVFRRRSRRRKILRARRRRRASRPRRRRLVLRHDRRGGALHPPRREDVIGRVPKTRKERVAVDERNASRPRWKNRPPASS